MDEKTLIEINSDDEQQELPSMQRGFVVDSCGEETYVPVNENPGIRQEQSFSIERGFVKDSYGEDTVIPLAHTQIIQDIRSLTLHGAKKSSEYEDLSLDVATGNLVSPVEPSSSPQVLHRVSSSSITQNMLYLVDITTDDPITPVTSPKNEQDISFDFKEVENATRITQSSSIMEPSLVNSAWHYDSGAPLNRPHPSCSQVTFEDITWTDDDLLLEEELFARKKSRLYRAESVQVPSAETEHSSKRRRNFRIRTQSVLDY